MSSLYPENLTYILAGGLFCNFKSFGNFQQNKCVLSGFSTHHSVKCNPIRIEERGHNLERGGVLQIQAIYSKFPFTCALIFSPTMFITLQTQPAMCTSVILRFQQPGYCTPMHRFLQSSFISHLYQHLNTSTETVAYTENECC